MSQIKKECDSKNVTRNEMLQLDQVISAPSSTKVSIRTAVYDLKQMKIIF